MIRPKHQRLLLVTVAVLAVLAAVLLAMWGLKDRAAYFFTASEVAAGKAEAGRAVRLGGMVEKGSVQRLSDGVTVRFNVTDYQASVPVEYRGILPDLFQEDSGVVAEGKVQPGGKFVADTILAKHDERYMPPQLGNLSAEHEAGKTLKK